MFVIFQKDKQFGGTMDANKSRKRKQESTSWKEKVKNSVFVYAFETCKFVFIEEMKMEGRTC